MKKFFLSAALIIAFGAYVTYSYLTSTTNAQQPATVAASTTGSSGSAPITTSTNTVAGSAPPTTTSVPVVAKTPIPVTKTTVTTPVTAAPTGQYVDGTYTGSAVNAYYGNIQVAATISGGKLTNVTFLQYPNDRSTSRLINQQAMSELKAEAIQSQSANVDGVSGASDSSAAFKESLASALSKAQA